MLSHLNKYRRFLFGILIISYALNIFQKPLFETLHFVVHLPQIIFSKENVHSYQSHHELLHQHQVLSKIEIQTNDKDEESLPINDQNNKKKIELIDTKSNINQLNLQRSAPKFSLYFFLKSTFSKVKIPPPQLFS